MNRKWLGVSVLVFSIVLVLCTPVLGQVLKGSISGTVVDAQGAVVANAQVKATHVATGTVLNSKSDNAGLFRFNLIPTGTYSLEVSGQGFKTTTQKDILVTAGSDTGLGSVQLAVGGGETTVEVTAATPLVETTQAQITNTFSGTVLSNFVGIQEEQGLDSMALFVPGIVSSRDNNFANVNGGGGFAANGIRGRNNDQQIDGQNNNDNTVAGPALFVVDPEFVQEYVLISNNFGPEYGRNAGSVVNIITKSGTNAWHGSVYENENNSILNSLTSSQKQQGVDLKQPPRANDESGGFSVGGPIVKNKAFFFGGFDQEILSTGTAYSTTSITPTPAGLATLAGCFPTGAQANAIAALSKFGPWGISAGNPTAVPTGPGNTLVTQSVGGCPGVQVAGISRLLPTPFHGFNFVNRDDVNISSHDTLAARYIFNRGDLFNLNDNGPAGYVFNEPALSQALLLSETHNFTNSMVNEIRLGFDRLNVQFGGNNIGTEPTVSNLSSAVTDVILASATPTLGFGVGAALPQGRIVNTWQAQDNWNYLLGKHSFKAGVNWTYQQSPSIFLPFINGGYVFTSLGAYVNNAPAEGLITQGNPELPLKEYDTFFYVGDDWKVARNLTLNLGVTYSYSGQPLNLLHTLGVQQQAGPNALWDKTLPSSVTAPVSEPAYKKAIGPSFGFAYSPQWGGFLTGNGKTTIRGGYRMAYDPSFYNIISNNYGGAPSVLFAAVAAPPLPAVPTAANVRPQLLAGLAPFIGQLDPRDLTEVTTSPNFRPDQVQSFSLGVQRELSRNTAVEVRFVGNHASNLFQTVNGNPFLGTASDPGLEQLFPNLVPAGDTPCPSSQAYGAAAVGRVNCNQGVVLSRTNGGYSNYEGVQTEFRANNMLKQLTARVAYTYSKTLDNSSEIFASGGAATTTSIAQNPLNTSGGEYSFSGLHVPQQFSVVLIEELPFFKQQHGFVGHLLGGWTVSSAYVFESGQRFTPITQNLTAPTIAGDFFDAGFLGSFASGQTVARPFFGNASAAANSVGIFAGDACTLFEGGTAGTTLCSVAPTQLLSLNAINATPPTASDFTATSVSKSQVRYIANTGIAENIFGTPFGNVPRNAGIDAPLNYLNLSVIKAVKFNERASFELRFTALNAFNHANFTTVVPTVDTAGNPNFGSGFGVPSLTGDTIPGSNLAASRRLYVGGTFRF